MSYDDVIFIYVLFFCKVASQAAMAVIPLVMEPRSVYYADPVVVLDFQALYPSMIIAYNLCFSTCIGKLKGGSTRSSNTETNNMAENMLFSELSDTTQRLGASVYLELLTARTAATHKELLGTDPFIAPNGSMFCNKEMREGILPLMLREILQTRFMVKRAMKRHASEGSSGAVLARVLDARQLALKLIANVTYGYTAAGFSGRMPMAELADAIVQSGRSTLEWTTREINSHPKYFI